MFNIGHPLREGGGRCRYNRLILFDNYKKCVCPKTGMDLGRGIGSGV